MTEKGTKNVIGRGECWTAHQPALGQDAVGLEEFESKPGVSQLTGELAARVQVVVAGSARFAVTSRAVVRSSWPGSAAQLAEFSLIWATKVLTAGKARSGRSRKMV